MCAAILAVGIGAAARGAVIAHWSFDDMTEGSVYPDEGGGTPAHRAVPANQMQVSSFEGDAPFGKGVQLSGKEGSYFSTPMLNNFQNGSFTIAVWFRTDVVARNIILADWLRPEYSYQFGLERRGDKQLLLGELRSPEVPAKERGGKNERLTAVVKVQPDKAVSANQWHHAAWVWKRTDLTHATMTVYLDGTKLLEQAQQYKSLEVVSKARAAKIGYREDSKDEFHGELDELWVYNEPLTAQQVKNLMRHNNLEGNGPLAKVIVNEPPKGSRTAMAAGRTPRARETVPEAAAKPPTPAPEKVAVAPPMPVPAVREEKPAAVPAPVEEKTEPAPAEPAAAEAETSENPPLVANTASLEADDTRSPAAAEPVRPLQPEVGVATARGISSARFVGIATCGVVELMLLGYFMWVMSERSKMRG
jgi:hypothetical protein